MMDKKSKKLISVIITIIFLGQNAAWGGANCLTPDTLRPRAADERGLSLAAGADRIRSAIIGERPYELLYDLRDCLGKATADNEPLFTFLKRCEDVTKEFPEAPLEVRWPILHAVTLLDRDEEEKLVGILRSQAAEQLRQSLIIEDSILLMHKDEAPANWMANNTPHIGDRWLWDISSELWIAQGGLGRVQQFKDIPMMEFLKAAGSQMNTLEPLYDFRFDRDGKIVPIDEAYIASLPNIITDLHEVARFKIRMRGKDVEVIYKRGITEHGIAANFVQDAGGYYTKLAYNYNTSVNPCTWDEFAEFFSKASLALINMVEQQRLDQKGKEWKPPIIHLEDSQAGLASVFRRLEVLKAKGIEITPENMSKSVPVKPGEPGYVLGNAIIFFSTHTIPNREESGWEKFLNTLDTMGIPREVAILGEHKDAEWRDVGDIASLAMRTADRYQCVSRRQGKVVGKFDSWWFKEHGKLFRLTAVTNGDLRVLTASRFRGMMLEKFPHADLERPTWEQLYHTKIEAIRSMQFISLDPNRPVIIYSGRFVSEKAGRQRALSDENIRELVKMGFQVVIYGNVQQTGESLRMEKDIKELAKSLEGETKTGGKLIFVPHFEQRQQRELLRAADILVLDSDPDSEAAGFTEVDGAVCGAIVIVPPWPEGILQAPNTDMDLDNLGVGNMLRPDIVVQEWDYSKLQKTKGYDQQLCKQVADAYFKCYKILLEKLSGPEGPMEAFLKNLAHYQATSIRLSRVLSSYLTAAEQLRQYDMAISEIEEVAAMREQRMPVTSKIEESADKAMRDTMTSI